MGQLKRVHVSTKLTKVGRPKFCGTDTSDYSDICIYRYASLAYFSKNEKKTYRDVIFQTEITVKS